MPTSVFSIFVIKSVSQNQAQFNVSKKFLKKYQMLGWDLVMEITSSFNWPTNDVTFILENPCKSERHQASARALSHLAVFPNRFWAQFRHYL